MTSKARKSLPQWAKCPTCETTLTARELPEHESNCPPNLNDWTYNFIHNQILYSNVELCKPLEVSKHINERQLDDMVFLSQSVIELCDIAIGDNVLVTVKNNSFVKIAWPTSGNTLTSVSFTKNTIEMNNLEGLVKVQKLNLPISIAKEFSIRRVGKQFALGENTELDILIKNCNEEKIFCIGNKFNVPYYGRKITYKIEDVKMEEDQFHKNNVNDLAKAMNDVKLDEFPVPLQFYKALYSTEYIFIEDKKEEQKNNAWVKYRMSDVGGYTNLISNIKNVFDIALGKCEKVGEFNISKGIMLYGAPGVGKSVLAQALISNYDIDAYLIHSSDIYSKSIGETEKRLKDIFDEAKKRAPSVILLEDLDTLCTRRSSSTSDHERRIFATLVMLFDDLQNTNVNVLVLATTSKIDLVEPSLRRPGRIDKEFEIYVPEPHTRLKIFEKLLTKIPHTLTEDDIKYISFNTHGYVAADLYGLCSQAIMNSVKHKIEEGNEMSVRVTMSDFHRALTMTKPSAMKEVLVEVPNVNWSDVGGQRNLKLKLKQAVDWPLRHPEAFQRMRIEPPRGLLMFGPPGCSKTMIAKALATESKVNFLNIKGPELFSKWVGESEKAVRDVFRKARQVAPSIIFIDEIDAIGGERSASTSGNGSNVQERVLATLLIELDGLTTLGNVTLVAATNRPDRIDEALLRPGRLDRIIYVPLPDNATREEIFNIKLRNMPVDKDVNICDLADLTAGYSGAEIQAICNEAAMASLEEDLNATIITKEHFKVALSVVTPRTSKSLIDLYDDYINRTHKL